VGSLLYGPLGAMVGGFLGDKIGGAIRDRDDRLQVYYNPADQTFFNEEGQIVGYANDQGLIDIPGNPYPGYRQISGISLDGHPVLVDAEGNLRTGQNGEGLYDPGINLNNLNGVTALRAANGQGITNTRGGELGQYQPDLQLLGGSGGIGDVGFQPDPSGVPLSERNDLNIQPDGSARPGESQAVVGGPSGPSPGVRGTVPNDSPYGGFLQSPGYQWVRDEMERAVRRNAVAKGDVGGAYDRRMADTISGLASLDYQNYLGNLQNAFAPGTGAIRELGSSGADILGRAGDVYGNGLANAGFLTAQGNLLGSQARRNTLFDIVGLVV